MPYRVPTAQDFTTYNGAHTNVLWREVGDEWRCPVCERTKFQILTWTDRQTGWGWLAALCWQRDSWENPRFVPKIICQHCNRAGYNVQRLLGKSAEFRFSPDELRVFVTAAPHQKASYDLEQARGLEQ